MGATACDLASELVRKKKGEKQRKKPQRKKNKQKTKQKRRGETYLAKALMSMCLSCLVVPICLLRCSRSFFYLGMVVRCVWLCVTGRVCLTF